MFDFSASEFISLAILSVAAHPAQYVYDYIANSPRYDDITAPPRNLRWRTKHRLHASLALIAGLVGVAIYLLTPHAKRYSQSSESMPAILAGLGVILIFLIARALLAGPIKALVRGDIVANEPEEGTKRFWLMFALNAIIGGIGITGAATVLTNQRPETCQNRSDLYGFEEQIAACDELLAMKDISKEDRRKFLHARGQAFYKRGDDAAAQVEYDLAIKLGTNDAQVYYDRALAHELGSENKSALADYDRYIKLKPDDSDALFRRGLLRLNSAQFGGAIADFTHAHEITPDDEWTLANRGMTYAWMNEIELAEKDFAAAAKIDPKNPVLLRGRALLHMQAEEFPQAIAVLHNALEVDPNDYWSLRVRSDAYWELGEKEKSWADGDLALKLEEQNDSSRAQLLPSN